MSSYKICASVSEEAEADYRSHTYYSVSCFENFRETAVRQVPRIYHLKKKKKKKSCGCRTFAKMYDIYKEDHW